MSYKTVWNTFKLIAERLHLSLEDRAAIFHDTAARVYRLQPLAGGCENAGHSQL